MARSRGKIIGSIAGVAALATVVTLAVTAQGYESQEVPRLEPSVWVLRDSGQYARVNTELAEIDTVRSVDAPDEVWQNGAEAVLFSQGSGQRWNLDPAAPQELVSDAPAEGTAPASESTPDGTREVVSAGPYIAYRTDTGQVSISTLTPGAATSLVDPFAAQEVEEGEEAPTYAADAIGISPDGILALYSAEEGAVRRFDIDEYEFLGEPETVADAPDGGETLAMTVIGDRWAMLQADEGTLWIGGQGDPVSLDVGEEARLQTGAADGEEVLIADAAGLVSAPLDGGDVSRVAEASGTPAAPTVVGDDIYAAWIDTDAGTLWADGETVSLSVPADTLESAAIRPVFRSNGDRAVLTEAGTGLIWTAPDGTLVPLEQWAVEKETEEEQGTVVEDVTEQLPPVAVNDAFGVRSGQQVILPVLFNDHDPNKKDVLTIDPASVSGGLADPAFGDLSLVGDGQTLVATVKATTGQTSFTYAVTDGAAVSPPATVTLNVVDPSVNTAPEWCGVEACQQDWPSPQLLPGGSTIVSALDGWVDPEGDAFVLADAYETDPEAPILVVPMADGRLAIRHTDPNAADAVIPVTVVVEDALGAVAEKTLDVRVTANPDFLAAPVAVTARAGEPYSIRIADHLTGGSGSYRLVDAVQTTESADGLEVTPNAATGTVDLTVTEPGQYVITYTAQDTGTQVERTAIIRVTAVDGSAPLAMAPLTAFVRESEDTTVDVLRAVQNTSGRVLIVSGATSSTPRLSTAVVGNERVRVSGTTEDGQPGAIGTVSVTVADGAGAAVRGTVTVFLAPPSTVTRPIVFADAITVRAGALARIDVTANDVAPRGEPLVVLPEVLGSGQKDELVFADGNTLRYLAPSTPGTYRLTYSVALERNPSLFDNGTVVVTVLPDGTNRAPTPVALEGRVLSGQTVSLPVPTSGMDPDGDRVTLADVTQPGKGQGTVTVAAAGDAIVYRAPAGGVQGGQVSFTYSVHDPEGDEGTGTVRIGVLDVKVDDAAPVTFSDYVRVRAGSTDPVVIDPRLNDLDPAQGELELIELEPNAPKTDGNTLYERLDSLIDGSTSLGDGRVALQAGDVAGTNSYAYTVRSTRTGSTAQGLIVVTVTEDEVLDFPRVEDSVLTARDRARISDTGIDVVTDRVRWASGDVGSLKLSLWGDQPGFTVKGKSIIGEAPTEGALVPFTLSGENNGREIVTHGFLHIPSFEDLRVQLARGADPVVVDEDASKSFDIGDYVDLLPAEPFEVGKDLSVQRAAATCTADGEKAEYAAGEGAPWSDTCLVPVRLDGQKRWSFIEVPISIRPAAPQLILSSTSQTVAPGVTTDIDMYASMASWEGGREGDAAGLAYDTVYSGESFIVTKKGSVLTVEAKATARPGTRERVAVSVPTDGSPSASLHLVVGLAPVDAPHGATFTKQCTVTSNGCSIELVGIPGEYDPFAGKSGAGLTLVSLGAGARCDVANVSVSGTAAAVSWPGGGQAPGGTCIVPFVVKDAQGRTGPGSFTLDLQGLPRPPASVSTVAFDATSVVLEVPLGEAAGAHPEVSAVSIMQDGSPSAATCAPSGIAVYRCAVSGLVNGEPHVFTAVATNAVGSSQPTSPHTSWAYSAPAISSPTATAVYRAGVTSTTSGVASLSINSSADVSSFRIDPGGQVISRTGDTTTTDIVLPPGPQTITVVPISQFQPPIGGTGNEGGAVQTEVTIAGAPFFDPSNPSANVTSNTSINVTGVAAQPNSGNPVTVKYVAWHPGATVPQCNATPDGGLSVSGGVQSNSSTISGLDPYSTYVVKACATNGYGVVESGTDDAFTFTFVDGPTGDATYTISTAYSQSGDVYRYDLASSPSLSVQGGFTLQYRMNGIPQGGFNLSRDSAPGTIEAFACHSVVSTSCSSGVPVTSTNGVPTIVDATFAPCLPLLTPNDAVTVSPAANGSYETIVPVPNATDSTLFDVTIDWNGPFDPLAPITHTLPACP